MKKSFGAFAVAFLFLAALPLAAQTGTWTAVGSTGVMDESATGIFQFGTTNLTYLGGSLNPIIARYNVTNTLGGAASDVMPWTTLELGYLDTNAQVAVQATLFQVNRCTGAQVPLCTVVSVDSPTAATCRPCTFAGPVNFATNLYYVQVVLTRQTAGVTPPQLFTLRIF